MKKKFLLILPVLLCKTAFACCWNSNSAIDSIFDKNSAYRPKYSSMVKSIIGSIIHNNKVVPFDPDAPSDPKKPETTCRVTNTRLIPSNLHSTSNPQDQEIMVAALNTYFFVIQKELNDPILKEDGAQFDVELDEAGLTCNIEKSTRALRYYRSRASSHSDLLNISNASPEQQEYFRNIIDGRIKSLNSSEDLKQVIKNAFLNKLGLQKTHIIPDSFQG